MSRSMIHLNGNQLCAIDVETTGLRPGFHEIHQIAILPLDSRIKPSKGIIPFVTDIKVEYPERIEPKAIKMPRAEFARRQQRAIDQFTAADLLDDWFERLKLAFYKRISPLAQNWPFDRSHVMAWLGDDSFEYIFSPLYRDTMPAAMFHSDLADFRSEKITFVQYNLQYLCQKVNVVNEKAHDALQDCVATAEVYRRLLLAY